MSAPRAVAASLAAIALAAAPPARAAPANVSSPSPSLRYRPVGCRVSGPAVLYVHGPRRREVALTFDDGPASITQSFVRMLKENGAVATFFMVGEHVSLRYRATMREELRNGDALGDHSWSHPDLALSGEVASQLRRTRNVIERETGYAPCVFRPPYGAYDTAVLRTARALGLATVNWNVDPVDWSLPGVAAIEQRVLMQVQSGSIVLSHDGGGPRQETLAAYPYIIGALHSRGYRFVTVPQLLGFKTAYRVCGLHCEGAAIKGRPPRGSIVEGG